MPSLSLRSSGPRAFSSNPATGLSIFPRIRPNSSSLSSCSNHSCISSSSLGFHSPDGLLLGIAVLAAKPLYIGPQCRIEIHLLAGDVFGIDGQSLPDLISTSSGAFVQFTQVRPRCLRIDVVLGQRGNASPVVDPG